MYIKYFFDIILDELGPLVTLNYLCTHINHFEWIVNVPHLLKFLVNVLMLNYLPNPQSLSIN